MPCLPHSCTLLYLQPIGDSGKVKVDSDLVRTMSHGTVLKVLLKNQIIPKLGKNPQAGSICHPIFSTCYDWLSLQCISSCSDPSGATVFQWRYPALPFGYHGGNVLVMRPLTEVSGVPLF